MRKINLDLDRVMPGENIGVSMRCYEATHTVEMVRSGHIEINEDNLLGIMVALDHIAHCENHQPSGGECQRLKTWAMELLNELKQNEKTEENIIDESHQLEYVEEIYEENPLDALFAMA